MIKTEHYEYRFYHPTDGVYISIMLYDKETYLSWKPYLDIVEKWFADKAIDTSIDKLTVKSQ